MATVQSRYGKPCPKCGSAEVLKPRLGYSVGGARAKCQACGFLILKTDRKIALEAIGTLLLISPLIFVLTEQSTAYRPVLFGVAVLGLMMTFWSYRLPDSSETIESSIHEFCSPVVDYGKYVLLALIAVLVVR